MSETVRHPDNLFADLRADAAAEQFQTLLARPGLRIERIVSMGQSSPAGFWYDQDEHEWVLLLQGAARLRFEQDARLVELEPGAFLHIPAHARHRVEWTDPAGPTVWLAIHYHEELA